MRKILLLALSLLLPAAIFAQEEVESPNFAVEGLIFQTISANGKFTGTCDEVGTMLIVNTETQDVINYNDWSRVPYLGYGRSISDDGTAVGSQTRESREFPCYFKDGEAFDLPVPEGVSSIAFCSAISPDGKYIVGQGLYGGIMSGSGSYPLLWTRQADDSYTVEILPHSLLDPAGAPAQGVSANAVSADGNVVIGHKTPYDPYSIYLIVWRKVDGEWQCDESLASVAWDLDACKNVPEFPGEDGPAKPNMIDYLSPEALALYNEALARYQEDWNRWLAGEIEFSEISDPPYIDDYLTPEELERYKQDLEAWKPLSQEYEARWNAWATAYVNAATGKSFIMNQEQLSTDGRYILSTISYPDPKGGNLDWEAAEIYRSVLIDTENGFAMTMTEKENTISTGLADDGTSFCYVMDLSDNIHGYAVKPDGKMQPFVEHLRAIDAGAAEWVEDNLAFSGSIVACDKNGNPVLDENQDYTFEDVENLVITGATYPSADGKKFAGVLRQSVDPMAGGYIGYFIDASRPANAIDAPTMEGAAEIYTIDGRRQQSLQKGINIVRTGGKTVKILK